MIEFNKAPGQRILEIGCGERRHPAADVAVDKRHLPHVDFALDVELPFDEAHGQAIADCDFDGVLCQYANLVV